MLPVAAGILGGATLYAGVFAVAWGVAAFCAAYRQVHGVDRFDPALRERFWPMFRLTLAENGLLYLVPIASATAVYLCAALVVGRFRGLLTIEQLLFAQHALKSASSFFDRWIKLGDRPLLLVLLGVYLVTCLLLAWRDWLSSQPARPAGRIRRMRYGAAVVLRRVVEVHGRYSGPAAAALATLASFTFLVTVAAPLGTQLRLQAVADTRDYRYATREIEENIAGQLVTQAISLVYGNIEAEMLPGNDRQILSEDPFRQQVDRIQQYEQQIEEPLRERDPAEWEAVSAEQARIQQLRDLPDRSVISSPPVSDAVAVPESVNARQAAAAMDEASETEGGDRLELIDDSGKEVVLQLGNTASASFWDSVTELVRTRFPLAAPLVDALSDSVTTQFQAMLRQYVPPLVNEVTSKTGDVSDSIAEAATDIADSVDVPKLVRGYDAEASQETGQRQAALKRLTGIADQLQGQAYTAEEGRLPGIVGQLIEYELSTNGEGGDLGEVGDEVDALSPEMQSQIVASLVKLIQNSAYRNDLAQQDFYTDTEVKVYAARAIQDLAPMLSPGIITNADRAIANDNCACD